jgi:prolyl-tRNA synthetase
MRMAHLFGRTLREAPADVEVPSHKLMVRAAMIRPVGAGLYSLLPLGWRVARKVEQIVREEMDAIGGQEVLMPLVQPADLWEQSGRKAAAGPALASFMDRGDRELVLALSHEEVLTDLIRTEINSYRQLPQIIYHIQTKFRDEPRARGGLIRVREFTMKDSYSLDVDDAGLDVAYEKHWHAYHRIFTRMGLTYIVVGADVGIMGGSKSEEFMAFSPSGEDVLLICPTGDYAANREVATFQREAPVADEPLPLEEIETPNTPTIQALADLLDISLSKTAKAVFYKGISGRFIFAVIRGDLDVNETKLRDVADEKDLLPASAEEIRAIGAEPGYGSPVDVHDAVVVVDESVRDTPNLVAGANKPGYHLKNVNLGRDYSADVVADIAAAAAGFKCPVCGTPLEAQRGIEVGNIFKLGTRYTVPFDGTYLDAEGKSHPVEMGCYGIGIDRGAATVAEQHHDERGLRWPVSVAPFHVSLLTLGVDDAVGQAADALYDELTAAGVEVLYDDRPDRAGVKFNDADLIGNPIRLSVSTRTLANQQAELKVRTGSEAEFVPLGEVVGRVQALLAEMYAALEPAVG